MRRIATLLTDLTYRLLSTTRLFVATILLLTLQSVWMALTAIYPLPFDEYYHFGIIQIYAKQWSPLISQQPPEASVLGDITRTGSYFYHYLLSFPYRVLDIFIDSQTIMVISFRLLNIAMVVGALILFRQLFIMWKVPKRVMNIIFLLFVCVPIVPFIAAHINYDNFILLITPIVLLFGTRLIVDKGDVAWNGAWYLIFGMVGMVAKETFGPLFLVTTVYVMWRLWHEHGKKFWHDLWAAFAKNIRNITFITTLLVLLIVGGLFTERYIGNLVIYKSYKVSCDVVQPESVCENYGPWYRNRENVRHKPADALFGNPLSFTQFWISKTYRGFFVPFSHTPTNVIWDKEPYGPIVVKGILPIGFLFGMGAVALGLFAVASKGRDLWKEKPLRFALVICAGYLLVVWAFNYRTYLKLGEPEAVQARYWYPILLLLFLLMVKSVSDLITSRRIKVAILGVTALCFIWGGGMTPWLIRADDSWRWQNSTVQSVNQTVQTLLRYTVIH